MRVNVVILAIGVWAVTSCASYRPIAGHVGQPDYNQRIVVENPEYSIRPNAIGVAVEVGLPIAGAAAGAMLGPVQKQTEAGRAKSTVGSAVFGALVGGGVSYLSGLIAGYRRNTSVNNPDKWAKRAGGDYVVVSTEKNAGGNRISSITLIDRTVENHFQVKNIKDIRDFAAAFPNSRYLNQVFDEGLKKLSRNDMPALAEAMPAASNANKAIERYINESPSFGELVKALDKYPTARDVEPLFVKLVASANDALQFNKRFPNSRNNRKVVANAFRAAGNPLSKVRQMVTVFGKDFELGKQDLSQADNIVRRNYFVAQYDLLQQKTKSSLAGFNEKYAWLTYDGKSQDVLDQWWPLVLKGQTSGKKVIDEMGQLARKTYAANAGINGSRIKSFVEGKLAGIIKDQVSVSSTHQLFSGSEEFEEWLKAAYTAGMVREDQGFKVLIYGEIKNNSIFDVPVEVNMTGQMFYQQHFEATGMAGGFLSGLKQMIEGLGGSVKVDERLNNRKIPLGPLTTNSGFAIPCLAAGKTAPYAILIDLSKVTINGNDTNKKGVNFADIIKATEELKLEDVTILTSYDSRTNIPQSQMKTQAEWLAMAKNGLPSSQVFDMWRNQRLRQSEWDEEWHRILTTPVPSTSESIGSTGINRVSGINYEKLKWPTEKELIGTAIGYDLGLRDEAEDYRMTGGWVEMDNGRSYPWRITVRGGRTEYYEFDANDNLFSLPDWHKYETYEEMLNEIIKYHAGID